MVEVLSPALPGQDTSVPALGLVVQILYCKFWMVSRCELAALIQSPLVALWPLMGNLS